MKKDFDLCFLIEERKLWKIVEESCLSNEQRLKYLNRKKAVDMYIDGYTASSISNATGLKGKGEAKRLLMKCMQSDEYGNYLGYAALLPYKHLSTGNIRTKDQTLFFSSSVGNAGLFYRLLREYPELKDYIDGLYFGKIKTTLEKNMSVKVIHRKFLDKCRNIGIKEYEYPFTVQSKAIRSLYDYINKLKELNFTSLQPRLDNDAYKKLTSTGIGQPILLPEIRPYSVVQIDGHKIDCITTIEITTPKGDKETKTIQRFWLLTIIDVATRAILGYHLTIKSAYDRFDVLKCIQNAIEPKQLLNFCIPGLEYPDNTGFPSTALPETEWAIFDEIMLDNALAHLSQDVISQVTTFLNATVNFGPVASPERRGIVERFFETLESRGYHRLVSTTGTGINDTRRRNAENDAIKYAIKFDHICELTEVLLAQYNNTPHNANNGYTPLEVMKQRIEKGLLPNYLEKEKRNKFMLNYITVTRKICGKLGTGRRPYVTFEGAEYRSDVLSKSFQLVGHALILKFNPDDIRTCKSFFEDGSEFCDLYVAGQWRNQPHSLKQRKEANKLLNEKKLKDNVFIDPVKTYDDYLIDESQKSKRARNKLADRKITQKTETTNISKNTENKIINKPNKNIQNSILTSEELEARFRNQSNKIRYN